MSSKKDFKERVLTAVNAGKTSTHEILSHLRVENTDSTRQKVRNAMWALEKDGSIQIWKVEGELRIGGNGQTTEKPKKSRKKLKVMKKGPTDQAPAAETEQLSLPSQ